MTEKPHPLRIWFLAARPKTLPAGIAPVLLGTAMAYGDGVHHWPTALVALIGSLAIQVGTNLSNDYFDYKKGADTAARIGPTRITQSGMAAPGTVITAAGLAFGVAVLASMWLIARAGWPVAVIAVASLAAGFFYTAGPRPLGYLGLGELFVLIFFGPVAVGGTYYVQSLEINLAVVLSGVAAGLFSAAILAVNNLRDIPTDRAAGKRTLAVRFGQTFARREYYLLIMLGSLTPVVIYALIHDHLRILWSSGVALLALPCIETVFQSEDGPSLNRVLAQTGCLLLIYSLIFAIGWIL